VQNLVLAPKEKVWTSPDGKTTVALAAGTFYVVLDPKSRFLLQTSPGIAPRVDAALCSM